MFYYRKPLKKRKEMTVNGQEVIPTLVREAEYYDIMQIHY